MEKKDFQYVLSHDQFKKLILEIKAIKAFNYKQFRRLTEISNQLIKNGTDDDDGDNEIIVQLVREIMSFNYKQFKKLNYVINEIMLTIDPNYKPIIKKDEVNNELYE